MSDNLRWKVYFSFGVGSIAIILYLLYLVLGGAGCNIDFSSTLLFSGVVGAMFLVSMVHFYTAYAFKFGRVDEVVGSRQSAVLFKAGKKVKDGVRIQLIRDWDVDDSSLTMDQKTIVFVCDWRPWVCSVRCFRCGL